jgi:transcriptional regulator with XRE-family HTH domain
VFTRVEELAMLCPVRTLGQNIRELREGRGFKTQRAFALALKVEQSRLADWETNRYKSIEFANLVLMAKVLRTSIDVLIEGVDPEYDLIRQKSDLPFHIDQLHSALTKPGVPHGNATDADTTRRLEHAISELHAAATLFEELASASADWNTRAKNWRDRIIDLQREPIHALARRQAPMGSRPSSGVPASAGGHARPADRRRRKRPA